MARRPTRLLPALAIVVVTIGCDRVTKETATHRLAGQPRVSLAGGSVRLEYRENRGGFLGLGAHLADPVRAGVFGVGTLVILGVLGVWVSREVADGRWVPGPVLLWAGGVANLTDRLARGSVVDFVSVGVGTLRTGVFNIADVAITTGAALVVVEVAVAASAQQAWRSMRRRTAGRSGRSSDA